MSTAYHAKYFAHELSRIGGDGVERLGRSLFDANVDLNPHQIEAALFAMRSPLSKGVVLADEVGLGKTIEAGLVLCQYWAERKRKILIICPASIRKQWELELSEKFNIPSSVLEAKSYREQVEAGNLNPFESKQVVITSLHYANSQNGDIRAVPWDLVVIDEAHKLRNAYRQSNRMGQNITWATEGRKKLLLTATPLQNSLLELYGLSSIIDENIFGDVASFRSQYVNSGADLQDLRDRLKLFVYRTLRSQVLEHIKYTDRKLITRPFRPTEQEQALYEGISKFLQQKDAYALPQKQKHLTILIVRKLLASSPHAVMGTLEVIKNRLISIRENLPEEMDIIEQIIENEDMDDEILDELLDREPHEENPPPSEEKPKIDRIKIQHEIEALEGFIRQAKSIGVDTKTKSLVRALEIGFEEMKKNGARDKAVIFTESRRTQEFLKEYLDTHGYKGKAITFNGTNREPDTSKIYEDWLNEHSDSGRSTGNRAVDLRTALIDHFRDEAQIMIATEAAAEGLNLQFCSLVVNFDLPWNPQRVEQRIGRCHRYGQEFDVVVINFLNQKNEADMRVHELLEEKFNLFTGIFGASDEVLGTIESGVDFERRMLDIYQTCRSTAEIQEAFEKLRAELDASITARVNDTRKILLEHFDEDVHSRLKVNLTGANDHLDQMGKMFWTVTKTQLRADAEFYDADYSFRLKKSPIPNARTGRYRMIDKDRKHDDETEALYRLSHPLGEYVLDSAIKAPTPIAEVVFDISSHPTKISVVDDLKGKTGVLTLQKLTIESFEKEEYLMFSGFTDAGKALDHEIMAKMFVCSGNINPTSVSTEATDRLEKEVQQYTKSILNQSLENNNRHFHEATQQLEKWADDMVMASEKELRDTKNQIKALEREARKATNVDEHKDLQEKIKALETQKRRQRQKIFDVEDEIREKRDALIDALEKRLAQKTKVEPLFTIRWRVA